MNQDFSGKRAVVTGGTKGIGQQIVERLTAADAQVMFTGTHAERGAAVAAATGAHFFAQDAAAPGATAALIAACHDCLGGGIDILVNNAGGLGSAQNVEATTPDAFESTFAVHLRAPWELISAFAPLMRASGGGSIVNMASVAGHRVGASSAAYSVAKAALIHLTRLAAAEFGAHGIRVNSVSPGFIATEIHASGIPGGPERGKKFVDGLGRLFLTRQALARTGQPADVAETVLFLASDAAAFITGADLVIDGGLMWGRSGLM